MTERVALLGGWLLAVVLAAALVVVVVRLRRERRRHRAELDRLSEWLDRAVAGDWPEPVFDESALSSLDARLRALLRGTRAARARVEQERDATQSMVGTIAHQAKTPLATIRLYAELAAETDLPAPARGHLERIVDQAARLDLQVTALVQAAFLESGAITIRPRSWPVAEPIAAAAGQVSAATGRAISIPDPDAQCWADPTWLREALVNLLDNAVKYSDDPVRVEVEVLERYLRIDVHDRGAGIAEEEQAAVFARFYRSPRTAGRPGLGIGLSVTRQVTRLHGGYVRVRSEPDRGSTFSLFWPRSGPESDRTVES